MRTIRFIVQLPNSRGTVMQFADTWLSGCLRGMLAGVSATTTFSHWAIRIWR
jgi:hypothetical protein